MSPASGSRSSNVKRLFASPTNLSILALDDNQLSGAVPASFSQLLNLQLLALQNNQLEDFLPDLSELTALRTVGLANNRFTFEDLEPLAGLIAADPSVNVSYSPQDSIATTVTWVGSRVVLSVSDCCRKQLLPVVPGRRGDS